MSLRALWLATGLNGTGSAGLPSFESHSIQGQTQRVLDEAPHGSVERARGS
jgi:hypothetical protein